MTEEQFHRYQEAIFDSFCMKTIENASRTIRRRLSEQARKEKSLSDLSAAELCLISASDSYDLAADTFSVEGETVAIRDPALAAALRSIPPKQRDVILLFYFLDKSEPQIGGMLRVGTTGIHKRRMRSLDRLRAVMEALDDA